MMKMTFSRVSVTLVLGFFVQGCSAVCKIESCKESSTKFTASFSPCPVHFGGLVNVSASGISPTKVTKISYDLILYFADDPDTPLLQLTGGADCALVKKYHIPIKCPVEKGEQLGVKNKILKVPSDESLDPDSYKVLAKVYDQDGKPLVCANIFFDVVENNAVEYSYGDATFKQRRKYIP